MNQRNLHKHIVFTTTYIEGPNVFTHKFLRTTGKPGEVMDNFGLKGKATKCLRKWVSAGGLKKYRLVIDFSG